MVVNNSSNQIGAGDVPITLDGIEMVLKPTWQAAQTISRMNGGIMGAIDKVVKLDIETIVAIVQVGLGYGMGKRAPPDLAERIWRSGLTDERGFMVERCVTYLRTLANGGKPPPVSEEDEENTDAADGKEPVALNP
jgi:hypothetical protein